MLSSNNFLYSCSDNFVGAIFFSAVRLSLSANGRLILAKKKLYSAISLCGQIEYDLDLEMTLNFYLYYGN
jgi:hypothetical protein